MTSIEYWKVLVNNCQYKFPDLSLFKKDSGDLITIGADLKPETLIYGYSNGYFPMYIENEGQQILGWFSPEQRGVFELDSLKVTRSMKKSAKKYHCKINSNFEGVMKLCMNQPRQGGWINEDFLLAYIELHKMGLAHSVETYDGSELVGGLYGVGFAGLFAGESMVSSQPDASKVALMYLVQHLNSQGAVLLDAQWSTPHLESLGATEIPRTQYLQKLQESLEIPSIKWGV